MRPALFLDRDGCLIQEVDYLNDLAAVKLLPGVGEALARAQAAGYALVVVTNQSGVARGFFDEDFVTRAHERLKELLRGFGVELSGIYYCPHHPLGNAPYNIACDCRKPKTGMLERAFAELEIQREGSVMVGDKSCDVELGYRAGLAGWLVLTGHGKEELARVKERFADAKVFKDLPDAVRELLE